MDFFYADDGVFEFSIRNRSRLATVSITFANDIFYFKNFNNEHFCGWCARVRAWVRE